MVSGPILRALSKTTNRRSFTHIKMAGSTTTASTGSKTHGNLVRRQCVLLAQFLGIPIMVVKSLEKKTFDQSLCCSSKIKRWPCAFTLAVEVASSPKMGDNFLDVVEHCPMNKARLYSYCIGSTSQKTSGKPKAIVFSLI